MAKETKKKEPKQKYGDYDNDGKVDSLRAFLTDIGDGGGRGGSGTSYSNLNHSDYRSAGGNVWGKDGSGDQLPSGWTNYDKSGRGQTQSQSPFMRNFGGAALGLLTGGPAGMVTGLIGQKIREDMQRKRGLLDAVQVGNPKDPMGLLAENKQAIAPTIQVAAPYAAEDLAMSQEVLPYGPQPMPLSTMGMNQNLAIDPFNTGNLTLAGAMTGPMNPPRPEMIPNPVPIPESKKGFVSTMPSGMSELRYIDYMRNRGIDVDSFPDVVRQEYQNYLNTPSIQGR